MELSPGVQVIVSTEDEGPECLIHADDQRPHLRRSARSRCAVAAAGGESVWAEFRTLSVPIPGFRGHRHVEPNQNAPALLYPVLAWPSLLGDIFAPNIATPWPFGYNNIFDEAFAKYPPERAAELCRGRDMTAEMASRIEQATTPNNAQRPVFQKLAAALWTR